MFQWCVLSSRKLRQQFCRLTHVGRRYFAFRNEFLRSRHRSLKGGWNPITTKANSPCLAFEACYENRVSACYNKCRIFTFQVTTASAEYSYSKCRIFTFEANAASVEYSCFSLLQPMPSIDVTWKPTQSIYVSAYHSKCEVSVQQECRISTFEAHTASV